MGVASRAATPITVASPLQRHGSRGDVARKSGPTSRTVTRRGASLGSCVFPFDEGRKKGERGVRDVRVHKAEREVDGIWSPGGGTGEGGKKVRGRGKEKGRLCIRVRE